MKRDYSLMIVTLLAQSDVNRTGGALPSDDRIKALFDFAERVVAEEERRDRTWRERNPLPEPHG